MTKRHLGESPVGLFIRGYRKGQADLFKLLSTHCVYKHTWVGESVGKCEKQCPECAIDKCLLLKP